ncbi:MAG: hypothetical protein ACLUUL_08185 [Gemmiger sp.]
MFSAFLQEERRRRTPAPGKKRDHRPKPKKLTKGNFFRLAFFGHKPQKTTKLGLNNRPAGCYNKENAAGRRILPGLPAYQPAFTVQSGGGKNHTARR